MAYGLPSDSATKTHRIASHACSWAGGLIVAMTATMMTGWFAAASLGDTTMPAGIPAIAVLPFDDMSAQRDLGDLSEGVAVDVISMLARSPELTVVMREASFPYGSKESDVRRVGRELSVGFVLKGSVQRNDDSVRITAVLFDARTGNGLWQGGFDQGGRELQDLRNDAGGKIVGALSGETGQLLKAQYRQEQGKDSAALQEYDYYLRGSDVFTTASIVDDFERAGAIWRDGLVQYPDSPLLKVKLGFYYLNRVVSFYSEDYDADVQRAADLAYEALTSANDSPLVRKFGHWLLARALSAQHKPKPAIAAAESAVALAPFDANMLGNLAATLIENGQVEKGLAWIERASSRESGAESLYSYRRGWAYTVQGKSYQAISALTYGPTSMADVPLLMAINLVRLGKLEDAKSEVARALGVAPAITQLSWRKGYFYSDPAILDDQIAALDKAGLPAR